MTLSFHKYGNQFFPGTGKFRYSTAQSELTVSTRNSIFESIENRGLSIEYRVSSIGYRGSRIGDQDAIMTESFRWKPSSRDINKIVDRLLKTANFEFSRQIKMIFPVVASAGQRRCKQNTCHLALQSVLGNSVIKWGSMACKVVELNSLSVGFRFFRN